MDKTAQHHIDHERHFSGSKGVLDKLSTGQYLPRGTLHSTVQLDCVVILIWDPTHHNQQSADNRTQRDAQRLCTVYRKRVHSTSFCQKHYLPNLVPLVHRKQQISPIVQGWARQLRGIRILADLWARQRKGINKKHPFLQQAEMLSGGLPWRMLRTKTLQLTGMQTVPFPQAWETRHLPWPAT